MQFVLPFEANGLSWWCMLTLFAASLFAGILAANYLFRDADWSRLFKIRFYKIPFLPSICFAMENPPIVWYGGIIIFVILAVYVILYNCVLFFVSVT